MNKKILSLVLALVMVLGTFTSVFAETKTTEAKKDEAKVEKIEKVVGKDNKINYIKDKKIVEGDEKGDLKLDSNIKRSEITKILVIANGEEAAAKNLQGVGGVYTDLKADHWANGYIVAGTTRSSKVNDVKMLNGYLDNTFKPENDVTYAELAKMLVVLAKNDLTAEMAKNAVWYRDWVNWANDLGIFKDVTVTDYNKAANRADAFTMLYNALYSMKEFIRVPSNETMGIISYINTGKIVLDQDSNKEFIINNDTVVAHGNDTRRQLIHASTINNFAAYQGTLVRVLTNDKKEVTHIIKLGDPKELAYNTDENKVNKDNNVWRTVADATIETYNYGSAYASLTEKDFDQSKLNKGHAIVNLNGDKTKGKSIEFINEAGKSVVGEIAINKDTKIYVANPYNSIMRPVKDINEALSLIGFRAYNSDFKIPNVYAGFDTYGKTPKLSGFDKVGKEAKVIVFNVVAKDAGGELYRIINTTGSNFAKTVENTDGKSIDINEVFNKSYFPLSYGEEGLYNVVEKRGDNYELKIKFKAYKTGFPVVKVEEVRPNHQILVSDVRGNQTLLDVSNADRFTTDQYKNLAKGDYLQFLAKEFEKETKNRDGIRIRDARNIEILSILPNNETVRNAYENSNSVLNVVQGIEREDALAKVLDVQKYGNYYIVTLRVVRSPWAEFEGGETYTFEVGEQDAANLQKYVGTEDLVLFNRQTSQYVKNGLAHDFRENKAPNFPKITGTMMSSVEEIKKLVTQANDKYNDNKVDKTNLEEARRALNLIDQKVKGLNLDDRKTFEETTPAKPYGEAIQKLRAQVTKLDDQNAVEKELEKVKPEDFQAIKPINGNNAQSVKNADAVTAVEKMVKAKVDTTKYTATVTAVTTTNPLADEAEFKFKVELKVTTNPTVKADKEVAGKISAK